MTVTHCLKQSIVARDARDARGENLGAGNSLTLGTGMYSNDLRHSPAAGTDDHAQFSCAQHAPSWCASPSTSPSTSPGAAVVLVDAAPVCAAAAKRHVGLRAVVDTSLYEVTSTGRRSARSGGTRTGVLRLAAATTWRRGGGIGAALAAVAPAAVARTLTLQPPPWAGDNMMA